MLLLTDARKWRKYYFMREEVNPDKPDNLGQRPLSHAAWDGHQEVVNILLMREDVNPYKPDDSGETPFPPATRRGHSRVAALLQSAKAAAPSAI